jgi:hypothetical protein
MKVLSWKIANRDTAGDHQSDFDDGHAATPGTAYAHGQILSSAGAGLDRSSSSNGGRESLPVPVVDFSAMDDGVDVGAAGGSLDNSVEYIGGSDVSLDDSAELQSTSVVSLDDSAELDSIVPVSRPLARSDSTDSVTEVQPTSVLLVKSDSMASVTEVEPESISLLKSDLVASVISVE